MAQRKKMAAHGRRQVLAFSYEVRSIHDEWRSSSVPRQDAASPELFRWRVQQVVML